MKAISKTKKYGTYKKDLFWRHANPETDFDIDGDPIKSNYSVIVRVKDCTLLRKSENGRVHYLDTKNAPQAIIINHNSTFSGYTEWKQVQLKKGKIIKSSAINSVPLFVNVFFRCTLYTIDGNKVYAKSIYSIEMPLQFKKRNQRKVILEKTHIDNQ